MGLPHSRLQRCPEARCREQTLTASLGFEVIIASHLGLLDAPSSRRTRNQAEQSSRWKLRPVFTDHSGVLALWLTPRIAVLFLSHRDFAHTPPSPAQLFLMAIRESSEQRRVEHSKKSEENTAEAPRQQSPW